MTSQQSFRPGARLGALALAFGVVSGAFALTAAPAFADTTEPTDEAVESPESTNTADTQPESTEPAGTQPESTDPAASAPAESDEAPVEATVSTDKANYAATDTVLYAGTGWLPGEKVTVLVEGPISGTLEGVALEDGTISGEIYIYEADENGNPTGGTALWEDGSYTLTVTQTQPDEPASGSDVQGEGEADQSHGAGEGDPGRAVVSATTTFTVGDPATDSGTPAPSETPRQLAETGADDVFGIAGLGLLVAGAGAAALVGRRFIAKKA